jgi:hypothetical protein
MSIIDDIATSKRALADAAKLLRQGRDRMAELNRHLDFERKFGGTDEPQSKPETNPTKPAPPRDFGGPGFHDGRRAMERILGCRKTLCPRVRGGRGV